MTTRPIADVYDLLGQLHRMLYDRAERGNAQSKHGIEAAYTHEIYMFVDRLDKLMDEPPEPTDDNQRS